MNRSRVNFRLIGPLTDADNNVNNQIDIFLNQFEKVFFIRSPFQTVVNKMRIFFKRLQKLLMHIDSCFDVYTQEEKAYLQKKFIMGPGQALVKRIDELFNEFTLEASCISEKEKLIHKDFVREVLHPLLLSIPFLYRAFTKPLGYTGDYEIVNMMLKPYGFEGENIYSKIINFVLLQQPAAQAHRNRIDILVNKMEVEAKKAIQANKILKIMSIGCGPAVEIDRFIREYNVSENCEFCLIDFNKETIEYVQEKINQAKKHSNRNPKIDFIQKSVKTLLKNKPDQSWNFIYCTGLFDYLPDKICKRLTKLLYSWLEEHGIVILSNVHSRNPNRCLMEFFAEWNLIYRNNEQMACFAPDSSSYRLFEDKTKINIFLELRK